MTALDYGRVRCSNCGTWYGLDESHTCPKASSFLAASPAAPTDLPALREGQTHRFYVVDHTTLIRRAVLDHGAAPALIGASL